MFLIIFLVLFPVLSQGIVCTFTNCAIFFFNGNPPTIFPDNNRFKQICQCLVDSNPRPDYYYATLYDTANKIPVYSAYRFSHGNNTRQPTWYIEPQLDGFPDRCMRGGLRPITNQAKNADYLNSGFDRGHLYPVRHTATADQMEATFTLTNAAPQDPTFNRGNWSRHELDLVYNLQACPEAFVVTGVVPGRQIIGNNVRVAKYYWSAYCCKKNGQLTSRGFIGPDPKGEVESMTVQNLETILSDKNNYGSQFTVFHGQC